MQNEQLQRAEVARQLALEVGFDRAGIAALEPYAGREAYLRWIERGHHGALGYLERHLERRLDPAAVMPGARSAVCVALRYAPRRDEAGGDLWSGVARYAHGRDYHDVVGRLLRRLGERLDERFPGSASRGWVDTGPVLERELAARAGLGAVGKNTLVLHPEDGSWFLLGELFTTLELAPDTPYADLCGSCTACLEACPTGAFPEPWVLDSRRCISFWTIEHRGSLPAEVRPQLGSWVFGCDVCQEVCPINAAVTPVTRPVFDPPEARRGLDLEGMLLLGAEEYRQRFQVSAMKRAKLGGLQRNAAVAMGNRGEQRYVGALVSALGANPDPVVRGHAAWALGRIGGERARGALGEAASREGDHDVRGELAAAQAALATRRGEPRDAADGTAAWRPRHPRGGGTEDDSAG